MYDESKLSNALVGQKDKIFNLIHAGRTVDAFNLLEEFREVWRAVGYHYKYSEILWRLYHSTSKECPFSHTLRKAISEDTKWGNSSPIVQGFKEGF